MRDDGLVTVRICLLGPVAVVGADGRPVDVGGPRARALLARLAIEPGRVVGLSSLIDAVWGDEGRPGERFGPGADEPATSR